MRLENLLAIPLWTKSFLASVALSNSVGIDMPFENIHECSLVPSSSAVLISQASEIDTFEESTVNLSRHMMKCMYQSGGIGLAGPQINVAKQIIVFNFAGQPIHWPMTERVLINPVIIEASEATGVEDEGCLSLPGQHGQVRRSKWVRVEADDVRGRRKIQSFFGGEARIVQHEIDHLRGRLFIDRAAE
jgi:peptide deformylase